MFENIFKVYAPQVGDALCTVAHLSLGLLLFYMFYKGRNLLFRRQLALFGTFLLLCGAVHALDLVIVPHTTSWLHGVTKALAGFVSFYTLIQFPKVVSKIVALRSYDSVAEELVQTRQQLYATESRMAALVKKFEQFEQTTKDMPVSLRRRGTTPG